MGRFYQLGGRDLEDRNEVELRKIKQPLPVLNVVDKYRAIHSQDKEALLFNFLS